MAPPSMTLSDLWPGFQVHDMFWSRMSKTKLVLHKSIPNIWNGIMFGDLDWLLNASRGFVSISFSWASCFYCATQICIARTCYGNVARWLAGFHTRPYCINTAKAILKLFRPTGSPIILVSSDPAPIPNSSGNPFSGGVKYTGVGGWGNLAIFDRNRRLSRKRCEIGRWLLWNVKSWVSDRIVDVLEWSLIPGSRSLYRGLLRSRISQNGAF